MRAVALGVWAACLVVFLSNLAAWAQEGPVTVALVPGKTVLLPADAFAVLTDLAAETGFEDVAGRLATGEGRRASGRVLNVGLTWAKLWAVAELRNAGAAPASWQLRTPLPAAGELEVLLVRSDGAVEPLLATSFRAGYASRPVDSRKLIAAPFQLDPGEAVQLAIGYRPLGFSRLPLWLASPGDTAGWAAALARGDAVFYTGIGVLIACFLGFCLVIRNATGVSFAVLLVLNLAVIAQIEGQLFRLLWPSAPLFNLNATMPLLLVAAAFGYAITLRVGRDTQGPRLRRAIQVALAASLLHLAATPFAHPTWVVPSGIALWVGTFAAIAASLPGWTEFAPGQRRIGRLVAALMLLASLAMVPAALSGGAPVWTDGDLALRLSYSLASAGLMALLLMQVSRLYQAHQAALQTQLAAARREAELNDALLQSERSYSEAMRRAAQARQDLAAASHDIQQPLSALRLLLRQDPDARPAGALKDALGYLDRLAGAIGAAPDEAEAADAREAYDLGMVVQAAGAMFRDEAAERGIALNVTGAEVLADVPTLTVMRVVSNLTVNAIRHSQGTAVTLSLTATEAEAEVAVTNDGIALSPAAFAGFLARGSKGEASEGDGLGLAIIAELCRANGMRLALDESFRGGTRLTVAIPRAH